jgi:hypothetical protein
VYSFGMFRIDQRGKLCWLSLVNGSSLTCPNLNSIFVFVMTKTKHTYKELELVKLLSEAIDELNQLGCEDIANDLEEKLENLLDVKPDNKMTFTYYDDETKTEVTKNVSF